MLSNDCSTEKLAGFSVSLIPEPKFGVGACHCDCFSVLSWADNTQSCRELLGEALDAEQAAQLPKTTRMSLISSTALAAKEKSAAGIPADAPSGQAGSGKQPVHAVSSAAVPMQGSSGATHIQSQATSEPTPLAALAATQAASKHQDTSDLSPHVTDNPVRQKTVGLKGSKNKQQSAKCAFCSVVLKLMVMMKVCD